MTSAGTGRMLLSRLFYFSATVVIVKVTLGIIWNNRHYFPADFQSDFLIGRLSYFYGTYQYAFYGHVVSGPISMLMGVILISTKARRWWPGAHRWLGRIQVVLVGLIVAPSGLWMAGRAMGGAVAIAGFAVLSVLTAFTVVMGYLSARQLDFREHERWMFRCFLLLASAVTLRLMSGAAIVADVQTDWIYPASAWLSWLMPLGVYEANLRCGTR